MKDEFKFTPIAQIISPYLSKFGIPRQSGMVNSANFRIRFEKCENFELALRGIEEFSHLWVLFVFHSLKRDQWKPLVAPPRFADSKKIGTFATRTPYRPNPIGQSVVKLLSVETVENKWIDLCVSGGDFLNGTPVLDIKPYVPYADLINDATAAWAEPVMPSLKIVWNEDALHHLAMESGLHFKSVIEETLSFDPRPGYERGNQKLDGQKYYIEIEKFDICWIVKEDVCYILQIKKLQIS